MTRALALLALAPLAGCAGSSATSDGTGAHVLFLVRSGCRTVVARTLTSGDARAFTVLQLDAPEYAPRVGDVLEGPAREGRSVFAHYPAESLAVRTGALSVAADVLAAALSPSDARHRLDAACGPEGAVPAAGKPG
jgi:hypothetical protein